MRACVVALALIVGCKGKASDPKGEPVAPGSGSGSGSAVAAGSGAGSGSANPKELPEDPYARKAYRAGMAKGRKATDKKQWADAIAGFDEALAAKKGDPRALGERGFARLLEGKDLAAATRDFDQAASSTKDKKLLSEIWFNRGLLEEKRGNSANAVAAFVIANTLRPTEAARKKLEGKTACPVTVSAVLDVPDAPPAAGADWLALAKAMPGAAEVDPLTTKEHAFKWLTGQPTEPKLPAIVSAGEYGVYAAYVVIGGTAGLRAIPLGEAMGGRCPGSVVFEVIGAASNGWILVSGTEQFDGGYTYMCERKDGELYECTGADDEVSAGTACFAGTPTRRTVLIDQTAGKVLKVYEQPDDKPVAITLDGRGIKLSGKGCDRIDPVPG
ncbi:MAG: hypothetical protein JNL83_30830 [Myxococcales bacterium]|nr:hypothetical protein [Myxococcales bacterium]